MRLLSKMIPRNKRDLLALYLVTVGPTITRPVQDPLVVLLLDNRLYIYCSEIAYEEPRSSGNDCTKYSFDPRSIY